MGLSPCKFGSARASKIKAFVEMQMSKTRTSAAVDPLAATPESYESAVAELETLVARLESGQMPLSELLSGYKRGAVLLAFCRDQLQAVENQIQVLENGQLKPWDEA